MADGQIYKCFTAAPLAAHIKEFNPVFLEIIKKAVVTNRHNFDGKIDSTIQDQSLGVNSEAKPEHGLCLFHHSGFGLLSLSSCICF